MRVLQKRAFTAFASLGLAVVTANCSVTQQQASSAAPSAKLCGAGDPTNLLGTWTLTAPSPPAAVVGPNPQGILMLDAACNISFQLMGSRPHHASPKRGEGAQGEHKTDALRTITYFGTYSVDPSLSTLTIMAARHSFPNLEGQFSRGITYTAASGGSPAKLIYKNSSPSTGVSNSGLVFSRQ
jgi:hypothetical protein